jgi:hypothetical protein
VKAGVVRALRAEELPAAGPGETVVGFIYESAQVRDNYADANRILGHRVVALDWPGEGECPAALIYCQVPRR